MHERARRHHFGVKKGVLAKQAMEDAAVPVGPVHHGRYAKTGLTCHGLKQPKHRFEGSCATYALNPRPAILVRHTTQAPIAPARAEGRFQP